MNVDEKIEGDCHVYAAALDTPCAVGYYSAVIVMRRSATGAERAEVFHDERLEDGKLWRSADEALAFALDVGVAAARANRVFGTLGASAGAST